jgi:hypothetical protein
MMGQPSSFLKTQQLFMTVLDGRAADVFRVR